MMPEGHSGETEPDRGTEWSAQSPEDVHRSLLEGSQDGENSPEGAQAETQAETSPLSNPQVGEYINYIDDAGGILKAEVINVGADGGAEISVNGVAKVISRADRQAAERTLAEQARSRGVTADELNQVHPPKNITASLNPQDEGGGTSHISDRLG